MTKSKSSTIAIVALSVLLAAALAATIVLAAFNYTRTATTTITFQNGLTIELKSTDSNISVDNDATEGAVAITVSRENLNTNDANLIGDLQVKSANSSAFVAYQINPTVSSTDANITYTIEFASESAQTITYTIKANGTAKATLVYTLGAGYTGAQVNETTAVNVSGAKIAKSADTFTPILSNVALKTTDGTGFAAAEDVAGLGISNLIVKIAGVAADNADVTAANAVALLA